MPSARGVDSRRSAPGTGSRPPPSRAPRRSSWSAPAISCKAKSSSTRSAAGQPSPDQGQLAHASSEMANRRQLALSACWSWAAAELTPATSSFVCPSREGAVERPSQPSGSCTPGGCGGGGGRGRTLRLMAMAIGTSSCGARAYSASVASDLLLRSTRQSLCHHAGAQDGRTGWRLGCQQTACWRSLRALREGRATASRRREEAGRTSLLAMPVREAPPPPPRTTWASELKASE